MSGLDRSMENVMGCPWLRKLRVFPACTKFTNRRCLNLNTGVLKTRYKWNTADTEQSAVVEVFV
jgi:hypothetical protein